MRLRLAVAEAALLLSGCRGSDTIASADLAQESKVTGLALTGGWAGSEIAVLPFDGPPRYYEAQLKGPSRLAVGQSGTMVAWSSGQLGGRSDLVVEEIVSGKEIVRKNIFGNLSIIGLNEKCERLVFIRGEGEEGVYSLQWASLDFSGGGVIEASLHPGEAGSEASWSPDGAEIAYEKLGHVYLFDSASRRSAELTEGHDPSWSPDGRWIAYRALDGTARIVNVAGKQGDWPLKSRRPSGAVRWSPDGRYVSLTEAVPNPVPLFGAYSRLVVCQVADGTGTTIREFGAGSGNSDMFRWILNYRSFCARCKRGAAFN